jgi:hypothetical protein
LLQTEACQSVLHPAELGNHCGASGCHLGKMFLCEPYFLLAALLRLCDHRVGVGLCSAAYRISFFCRQFQHALHAVTESLIRLAWGRVLRAVSCLTQLVIQCLSVGEIRFGVVGLLLAQQLDGRRQVVCTRAGDAPNRC